MTMPGFTADAVLHGGRAYRKDPAPPVSSESISPALRTQAYSQGKIRGFCANRGGLYWPPGKESSTYGCLLPNGDGIVCGGSEPGCDTF